MGQLEENRLDKLLEFGLADAFDISLAIRKFESKLIDTLRM